MACWNEDLEKIRSLLETREAKYYNYINETDAGGQNLLHLVSFWGSLPVAELLVEMNIDVNAINIQKQRPLDVAMMWGHVEIADLIRSVGGKSVFEMKIEQLEGTIRSLESDLAESRRLHAEEIALRKKTEEERDYWIETAHFVQKKWLRKNTEHIISEATNFAVQESLFQCAKKRDDLNDKWADATAWAAGADMVAKRLWSRMRLAEEHERANRECMQMALEERRAALIDRKIALNIRDHAVEAQLLAERSCEVALRSSKEAQDLARRMVPYKKKAFQLMRQLGMKDMREKFKSVFELCPPKVLNGAIQTLANLCEERDSPALPQMDIQPIISPKKSVIQVAAGRNKKKKKRKKRKKLAGSTSRRKGTFDTEAKGMLDQTKQSDEDILITPLKAAAPGASSELTESVDASLEKSATLHNEPRKKTFLPQVHADALDWGTFNNDASKSGALLHHDNGTTIADESAPTRKVATAPLRVNVTGGVSSAEEELKHKGHAIALSAKRPTTASDDPSRGVGIFRRLFDSVRMPRTQAQEDRRRQKGEIHRMGLPPEVPFDLLVLDPYGTGVEVLTCTHVRNDSHGFQRLRVTHKKDLKIPYRLFNERDEMREMEFNALMAEQRSRLAQKRNAKNRRKMLQGGIGKKDKLGTYGLTRDVVELDRWANDEEIQRKKRVFKLKRLKVEKNRVRDKYNSSDEESQVFERKLTWENIDL